jgi:hypothetical protein
MKNNRNPRRGIDPNSLRGISRRLAARGVPFAEAQRIAEAHLLSNPQPAPSVPIRAIRHQLHRSVPTPSVSIRQLARNLSAMRGLPLDQAQIVAENIQRQPTTSERMNALTAIFQRGGDSQERATEKALLVLRASGGA